MTQDITSGGGHPSHPSHPDNTPAGNRQTAQVENQYADANDPDRKKRREKLGEEIRQRVKNITFFKLTEELDLNEQFNKFEAAAGSMFDGLAKQMPPKPKHPDIAQESQLSLGDYQTNMVPGSSLQPDGLFFHDEKTSKTFATAQVILEAKWLATVDEFPKDTLGQIGDYVLRVWEEQFTRVYVPVLVLHGGHVSIMVFTRNDAFVAYLGQMYHSKDATQLIKSSTTARTLRRIWFFLTLSTMELGNVCDVGNDCDNLRFYHDESLNRMERTAKSMGDDIVRLGDRIKRPVKIFRRTSYMFWAEFDGQPVVLKLVWTPTYCYPEGAGYRAIEDDCAGLIPQVLKSGVLIPDSFGYRLEFLIIENCGITIDTYAVNCRNGNMERNQFSATLVQAIRSVATCLEKAYAAGVLHRDVSAGNIAIKNNKARLIDWGYSRLRNDMEIPNLASIEEEFAFKNKTGSIEGRRHDSLTGTPFFMSIQVLLETKARGLIHDLESLFYVGLYAYATFSGTVERKAEKYPLGFQPNGNQAAAAIRVGCLSSIEHYRELFGVTDCPEDLASLLDGMYRLLFIQDGEFIGGKLLARPDFERHFDLDKAAELLFDGPIDPENPPF
ncbi:hypothetical protein IWW50_000556 [Coemansia erecta]|nr:hypothetical protein IWW50_000556 [Coemansia erecta]